MHRNICGIEFKIQFNPKYFPLPLDVRWLDGKRWQLLNDFEYHRDNEVLVAEKGFITDFGSPAIVWYWVGSPTDEAGPAYVIHDRLCETAGFPRAKADYIFYEAMERLDVPYVKRTLMYWAVRLWGLWRQNVKP